MIKATGGTEIIINGYKYHVFLSDDVFSVTKAGLIEYLLLGGGGAGGQSAGGGGGAGGKKYDEEYDIAIGDYSITIGNGGIASGAVPENDTGNGENSLFDIIDTAIGGGFGG